MTTPTPVQPTEPENRPPPEERDIAESERRVKRGCFMSLIALLSMTAVLIAQTGISSFVIFLFVLIGIVIAVLVITFLPKKQP